MMEESKEVDRILEQERLIDIEIKQEIEKYKQNKHSGIYLDEDEQESMEVFASSLALQDRANGQKRIGVAVEGN